MKTLRVSYRNASLSIAAAATAGFLSGPAAAQSNETGGIARMVNTLFENLRTIPDLIGIVAYIAGAAFGIAGIFKLKQHVDNPQQAELKDGLMRLGAGGGLIALPFVLQAVIDSFGGQTGESNLVAPSTFQAPTRAQ